MPKTYWRRRQQGRCGLCGDVPRPGRALCERCLQKARDRYAAAVAKRLAQGLCRRCGLPPEPGLTVCEVHGHRRPR